MKYKHYILAISIILSINTYAYSGRVIQVNNSVEHTSIIRKNDICNILRPFNQTFNTLNSQKDYYSSLYIGVKYNYAQNMLSHQSLLSNSSWNSTTIEAKHPSIEIIYMINKKIGFGTGLKLDAFNLSTLTRNYYEQLPVSEIDIDGDEFFPILNATQLEQKFKIETLDIPLFVKFKFGSFYIDLGANFSKFRKATYSLNGITTVQGYYPTYNVTLSDIPEYNYNTTNYSDYIENFDTPSINISAIASMGFFISLHPNIAIKFGTNALYGLTNVKFNKTRQVDLYRATETDKMNTRLITYGAEIGFYFKLLNKSL